MKEIRLLAVLRSLDRYEFKKLGEMVYSPYFNKSEKCKLLYELLKQFYPHFEDEKITKEWMFFQLFPEKKKMTSTLNTIMSQLEDLAEEHLIQQELKYRFLYKKYLLLKCLLNKGLHKQYQSHYKETILRYANILKRDSLNFLEEFLIKSDYHKYTRISGGRDKISSPISLSKYLDSYYWIQKLNLACEIEAFRDISSSDKAEDYELIELIQHENLDLMRINPKFQQSHISLLFRKLLESIQQPDNEPLFDEFLILFLNTNTKAVDKLEYNEFFIHSINYCIDKIIQGKGEYRGKLFQLYKLIVEFKLIYDHGYLNLNRVKNIISCAVQVGELQWAIQFLENYKDDIRPDQFNSAY